MSWLALSALCVLHKSLSQNLRLQAIVKIKGWFKFIICISFPVCWSMRWWPIRAADEQERAHRSRSTPVSELLQPRTRAPAYPAGRQRGRRSRREQWRNDASIKRNFSEWDRWQRWVAAAWSCYERRGVKRWEAPDDVKQEACPIMDRCLMVAC